MTNEIQNRQDVLADLDGLDRITRFAEFMSSGHASVPECFRNNPSDCLSVCLQAQAWGMNPYAVAQKTYVIKGKLGYEAQLVNAVINRHAPINGRLQFTWSDGWERVTGKQKKGWPESAEEGLWVEISATMKGEDQPRVLRLLMSQAWPRNSTLWNTDPKQQIAYTAINRWARLHCPDVILGVYSVDELQNIEEPGEKDVTPKQRLNAVLTRNDDEQTHQTNPGSDAKQRIRENMRRNGQVVDTEPTDSDRLHRQMCLDTIQAVMTTDELTEAAELISLNSGNLHADYVQEVREAYRIKRQELETAENTAE